RPAQGAQQAEAVIVEFARCWPCKMQRRALCPGADDAVLIDAEKLRRTLDADDGAQGGDLAASQDPGERPRPERRSRHYAPNDDLLGRAGEKALVRLRKDVAFQHRLRDEIRHVMSRVSPVPTQPALATQACVRTG